MPLDSTSNALVIQDDLQSFSDETLSLINKSVDAVHNLKYLTISRIENALEEAKEKNKKLLQKIEVLSPPHDLSFHYGILTLMGSFTKAPLTGMALMVHSVMPKKETSAISLVKALAILGREIKHPTIEEEGLGFQTILPTVAKKILMTRYKISEEDNERHEKIDYAAIRESINPISQSPEQSNENPALIKKGETLASIIKDIISRNKMFATFTEVEYEKFISIAIDHILQDQKRYNLTSATRQGLLAGTSIDRQEIETLLKTLETRVINGEAVEKAQDSAPKETPSEKQVSVSPETSDPSVSDVVTSWQNNIHQDFLTDGFRIIVKKVCSINDTTNLEAVFIKYCDKTVATLTESLKNESPDIQKEILAFLTWVRKSYLSSQKPEVFEKLPFYSVIEAVARGVNGTSANGATNSKITLN